MRILRVRSLAQTERVGGGGALLRERWERGDRLGDRKTDRQTLRQTVRQ